jgi:hypothetical protein
MFSLLVDDDRKYYPMGATVYEVLD